MPTVSGRRSSSERRRASYPTSSFNLLKDSLRSVRAQLESDMERREKSTELRVKGLEEGAQEELEELRTEAQEKIQELEGAIEEL